MTKKDRFEKVIFWFEQNNPFAETELDYGSPYELIVAVKGEIHPETGFVMDMKVLKQLIETEIEEQFDHKNLNEEVPEFKTLNPTAENISVVIWNKMRSKIDSNLEITITLYETPRNFVVYSGE